MSTNPFDEQLPSTADPRHADANEDQDARGTLSAEDQAEYDRLAAEEAAEQGERDQAAANGETDELGGSTASDIDDEPSRLDEQAAAVQRDADAGGSLPHQADDFPVDAYGNVRAADAVSESAVYDTPWGRREMTHDEVAELAARKDSDRVVCTLVDGDAETSLQREKDDMAHIRLSDPDFDAAKN